MRHRGGGGDAQNNQSICNESFSLKQCKLPGRADAASGELKFVWEPRRVWSHSAAAHPSAACLPLQLVFAYFWTPWPCSQIKTSLIAILKVNNPIQSKRKCGSLQEPGTCPVQGVREKVLTQNARGSISSRMIVNYHSGGGIFTHSGVHMSMCVVQVGTMSLWGLLVTSKRRRNHNVIE